jgi:hypothetical protein
MEDIPRITSTMAKADKRFGLKQAIANDVYVISNKNA